MNSDFKKYINSVDFPYEKSIKKRFINVYNVIIEESDVNLRWSNKLYNYIHNITKQPKCIHCEKKETKYVNYTEGYREYCSIQCSSKSNKTILKRKDTCLDKYGEISYSNTSEFKKKVIITNREKYGVDYVSQNTKIREKQLKTNLEKYHNKSPLANSDIREKIKQTFINKHGVEHPSQVEYIKNKTKDSIKSKYDIHPIHGKDSNKKLKIYHSNRNFNTIINKSDIKLENLIYDNGEYTIVNYCDIHDNFTITYNQLYNRIKYGLRKRQICTSCNKISYTSSITENEIKEFLLTIDSNIEKKIFDFGEIDCYSKKYNIGIEYNGLYWHSSERKPNDYHINKTNNAQKAGIELLHINEDEWKFKKNIVKSIINKKFNNSKQLNYINSSNCIIKNINRITHIDFVNENNIESYEGICDIELGMYHNDKLISILSFQKKNNNYEIRYFCDKLNVVVNNSLKSFLNYFKSKYQYTTIISRVNRRYYNGLNFEKLNFFLEKKITPQYQYYNKHSLYKVNEELIDVKNKKYIKVYDCGYYKYVLKL
jgi:hypothetical protein